MDFHASKVQQFSDEDVESYLKATSPESDDLSVGKEQIEEKKETAPVSKEVPKEEVSVKPLNSDKKVVKQFSEEEEQILIDANKEAETKEEKVTKKDVASQISYKDFVSYMVEEGDWEKEITLEDGTKVDLTQVPDEEFTSEVYGNLLKYQNNLKAQKAFQEEVGNHGEEAIQLLGFLKEGGKLADIAQYYQESSDISSIDVKTEDGAVKAVREYYERTGEDKEWIDDYIETLKDKGPEAILKDGERKQAKVLEAIKEERQSVIENQKEIESQRKIAEDRHNRAIREAIHSDNAPEREKREHEKYVFETKFPHPANQNMKVSQYWLDFQKINADPVKAYKLQKFIKNIDKFEEKAKVENETKKSIHTFLRKNQNSLTKQTSESPVYQNTKSTGSFDFEKVNKLLKG